MKLVLIGAITGLVLSISWIIWGFGAALAILLTTAIFALIGLALDLSGFSFKKIVNKLSAKLAE
ncbi:hypothetical protein [Limosilactobacillus fastidiosus]|uniref:DUF2273 domain-containing protein n=1 Tax=Limosilactobacillus fastidiosus TaxID=2759855 RepID=A0A7W3U080_9LACO|nr:hypothetical protein [Limosilactobacillus fastidiosus]MBB1062721.1 hypothetical protein [Limosilactobacillus fastidiosus]MBB1086544.1 hypothetical protein [Limosilactobacillus fastidiosus]MCD7084866.1 hypothetical protein [Limosilactobacillus fastidiosus]MCD7085313.1 hypothetical protein [Limosilactobacillus fastidiosus]MCD7115132.1 hypothetical protein [Limosilactobacillus fastidiosus]